MRIDTFNTVGDLVGTVHNSDPDPVSDDVEVRVAALADTVAQLVQTQAGVDPEVMAQLVTLGASLVGSAGQLQSALGAVSSSNTAKAPLLVINGAVQAAAEAGS